MHAPSRVIATTLYAATLLLSGALLFAVQPMIGKLLLPLVGGAPAAWNVCMVFFQAALLAGYAYAYALTRVANPAAQACAHLALLVGAALALPIALPPGAADGVPRDGSPALWLLAVLGRSAGLPFFALAASMPLFGSWFARTVSARGAFALYAASNAGSLLGLLAYPTLVEPALDLAAQARAWSAGYAMLVALAALAAVRAAPHGAPPLAPGARSPAPAPGRRLRWVALAAVPSSLTLGATAYLTTDIAAVPLLWTVPLALYLASFVLVFAPRPLRPPAWAARGYALLGVCLLVGLVTESVHSLGIAVPLHLVALFLAALVLHGALAADRPGADRLPEYFLWIALGGVLGGIANALVAPLLFRGVTEYPLALIAGCALLPSADDRSDARSRALDLALPAALGAALALAIAAVQSRAAVPGWLATVALFAPAAMLAHSFVARPRRLALAALAIFAASALLHTGHGRLVRAERSFFGVVRLTRDADGRFLQLVHGNILHGRQALDPSARCAPTLYFDRSGPLGDVFRALPLRLGARVAAVGLGAGTIAAYARAGERWTFYEINPDVVKAATREFHYLADCGSGAAWTIELGDARLELARAEAGAYDRIVLDAFDSDSIPVHLLTREALALFLSRLADDGVLVLHLSNAFLDLRPVVAALAADAGLVGLVRDDRDPGVAAGKEASRWAVLARRSDSLAALARDPRWMALPAPSTRPWTDAHSSLWEVLDGRGIAKRQPN